MQPFVGQITLFPYNFAPLGWAFCAGQLLPINQYTALFSLLGTQFGGDGRSNFGLPDLRGRAPIGQGQGPGLSSSIIGQMQGAEQVTLTTATIPPIRTGYRLSPSRRRRTRRMAPCLPRAMGAGEEGLPSTPIRRPAPRPALRPARSRRRAAAARPTTTCSPI